MTNIVLDTNIWIYLTKDTFFELWLRLKEMEAKKEIRILLNDVILLEWERNKPTTIKSLTANIKAELKSANNLSNYLEGKEKEEFLKSISVYKDEAKRIEKATERVNEVEQFMKTCTIIDVTEKQKLFVADLAIKKLPPFQNNKNNFNDVLIFRNLCEYVEDTFPMLYDLIYVSNNPDDFIDKNSKEIFLSILENLKSIRLKNVTELGEALKLAPELIENFDEWIESKLESEALWQWEMDRENKALSDWLS